MLTEEQAKKLKEQLLIQVEKLPEEQRVEWVEWIETASLEDLEEFIRKQGHQGEECLFCGIVKGNIETTKIYENPFVIAFLDITPSVIGQTIIIPKEHWQFIFQVPDQTLWEMTRIMKILMPIIVNVTKCSGINIYVSQGAAAGQRIGHVAINLIPRFEKDKAIFLWERKEVSKDEIEKVAKEIKFSLEKTFAEEREKIAKKIRGDMAPEQELEVPKPEKEKLQEFPRRIP
ncbi:MAG: HIT domain-containing protein [Candidatus Pacearchaeota archaeon]